MRETNIVIAGVGGQGVLSASRLIAQAAIDAGQRVVVGDTFGASQREGSVMSTVRIGDAVRGSLVALGAADFLIAFEPYEALRRLHFLRDGGAVIVNTAPVVPVRQVLEGGYPALEGGYQALEDVWSRLEAHCGTLHRMQATEEAAKLAARHGSRYDVTNVIILGAACTLEGFPVSEEQLESMMKARFKANSLPMNLEALAHGKATAGA